jgi:hypothetical protein
MQNRSATTAAVLGVIAFLGIYQAQASQLLDLVSDESILTGAANIVLVYFILALLIERACEVALSIITAVGLVVAKDASGQRDDQKDRIIVSVLICLVFAAAISLAGLRLVEMILNLATQTDMPSDWSFRLIDALLTSLILAGGSDGIHQIMRKILGEKIKAAPTQ